MPRPCKRRRVCAMPGCRRFSPTKTLGEGSVALSIDEFETVRLIDYEGLDQAECAERMDVARTTVQAIHSRALAKVAAALVEGRELVIGGGDFFVCDKSEQQGCGRHACCRSSLQRGDAPCGQRGSIMRIAVPYDEGKVFQHFGHAQAFKVYEVEDGKVVSSRLATPDGAEHCAMVGVLADGGVDALICGGIGSGAVNALTASGMRLYAGVSGSCDEAVERLLAGTLEYGTSANCDHHEG